MSTIERRKSIIEEILSEHAAGAESLGTSIRRLRLEITGLDQATFAKACKVTVKTLSSLENDSGNPTLKTLNAILHVFGLEMQMGLRKAQIPSQSTLIGESERPRMKRGSSPERQQQKRKSVDPGSPSDL